MWTNFSGLRAVPQGLLNRLARTPASGQGLCVRKAPEVHWHQLCLYLRRHRVPGNPVALDRRLTLRTGVLPYLQLASVFLVFLVSVFSAGNADARVPAAL